MNRDRLELQIDVLRQVAETHRIFDMGAWLQSARTLDEPCRTAACAFGYGALDPRLQAEGLCLRVEVMGEDGKSAWRPITTAAEFNALTKRKDLTVGRTAPWFGDCSDYSAATAFFDISRDAADWLFDPDRYRRDGIYEIRPERVIERINIVIELDGAAPDPDDNDDC